MVPSDRISQNVGSKRSKSNDLRKIYYKNTNKILPQCLPFQFRPMIYACTEKLRKTSMVEPFSWWWWLNIEPLSIAYMTDKMFRPRISLKIGWFGPGLQWSKCRTIFWKENQCIFDQFVLSLFSARKFYNWGFSHFEKWNFLNSSISIRIFIVGIVNLF